MTNENIESAVRLIQGAQRIALVTHIQPDPDAIGALLGLGLGLTSLGKEVELFDDDVPPDSVSFLSGVSQVRQQVPAAYKPDLVVALDSSDAERLGETGHALLALKLPLLSIDHHATNSRFGMVNWVDEHAASTAEMIPALLDALGVEINTTIATSLYAGILGDTVGFSTASVSPGTMRTAGRLIEYGIDVSGIAQQVLRRKTLDTLRLWGIGLRNLYFEQGVVYSVISREERAQLNLEQDMRAGLSTSLRDVAGVVIAAVFSERDDGTVDVSLRAAPGYDVAGVALSLGGGGHILAAGATVDGPLDDVVKRVVNLLKAQTVSLAEEE